MKPIRECGTFTTLNSSRRGCSFRRFLRRVEGPIEQPSLLAHSLPSPLYSNLPTPFLDLAAHRPLENNRLWGRMKVYRKCWRHTHWPSQLPWRQLGQKSQEKRGRVFPWHHWASFSWSSCLSLLGVGITGRSHSTQLIIILVSVFYFCT